MEPKEKETAGGVGPGISGASGEIIEGTGHDQGVGGTGHDNDADAAGMRPQDEYTARPDARQPEGDAPKGVSSTRLSGSASGSVGGGGERSPRERRHRAGAAGWRWHGASAMSRAGSATCRPPTTMLPIPITSTEGRGSRSERTNHVRAGNPGTEDEH